MSIKPEKVHGRLHPKVLATVEDERRAALKQVDFVVSERRDSTTRLASDVAVHRWCTAASEEQAHG